MAAGRDEGADGSSGASRRALSVSHLIDRRGWCRLAYEPIADLARGVICGFEALARFPEAMSQEGWAQEAAQRGLEPDLDAYVVGSVLEAREELPDDCFLSCRLRPQTLLRAPVQATLARYERLDRLVVGIGPPVDDEDEQALVAAIARLRAAGAAVAVGSVGGSYSTLRHLTLVRPEFVKLDEQLVDGLHRDDAKRATVQTLGKLASHLDAWLVAQGVATVQDLDALIRLRVPLAQGPLIGVRAKTLTRVAFALSSYVRERGAARAAPGVVAALIERPRPIEHDADRDAWAHAFAADPAAGYLPLVDRGRRPVGVLARVAFERGDEPVPEVLAVGPSASLPEAARRAMLRPPETRFDPLVCCDVHGRYIGLVPIERLVAVLARAPAPAPAA